MMVVWWEERLGRIDSWRGLMYHAQSDGTTGWPEHDSRRRNDRSGGFLRASTKGIGFHPTGHPTVAEESSH